MESIQRLLAGISMGSDKKVALVTGASGELADCLDESASLAMTCSDKQCLRKLPGGIWRLQGSR